MKRIDHTERASGRLGQLDEIPLAGEAALAEALFGAEARVPASRTSHIRWQREWGLWASLTLAALLARWRLTPTPADLALATGSVLGVALAYVWMRRVFGAEVAVTGALLLAASEGLVIRTGGWPPLVPPLLALWALLLFSAHDARTTFGAGWRVLAASVPLALAAWILPPTGALAILAPIALAMRASTRATRAILPHAAREWRLAIAAVLLPWVATTLGAARGDRATSHLGVPGWLVAMLLGVVVAGWLALTLLLLAPARALWRWYALASDPFERRRAVWRALLADRGWAGLALLWLACMLPAPAVLVAPRAFYPLVLLPAVAALPGMVVVELRARRTGVWATWLWIALLGALALALAVVSLRSVA